MTAVPSPPVPKAKRVLMTSDEFEDSGSENGGYELIEGKFAEKNTSVESAWVGGKIVTAFNIHLKSESVGLRVRRRHDLPLLSRFPKELASCRRPLRRGGASWRRLPADVPHPAGPGRGGAPPGDKAVEVEEKVEQYLAVGVRQVWLINPLTRTASVHRANGSVRKLHEADEFDGEDVIPCLRFKLSAVLPPRPLKA